MSKCLHVIIGLLLIIGGLNWGLVGFFNYDLVASIFGAGSFYANLVYDLVGIAAIARLIMWYNCSCGSCKR